MDVNSPHNKVNPRPPGERGDGVRASLARAPGNLNSLSTSAIPRIVRGSTRPTTSQEHRASLMIETYAGQPTGQSRLKGSAFAAR